MPGAAPPAGLDLPRIAGARPRRVVLILTDDQRYDALGFLKGQAFVETPHLDALAARGVHFRNAYVTTALCSPSRASILSGLYAHRHRVVDNNNPVPRDVVFFPQYLKGAGYDTAFLGKWHMGGEHDEPQPGFDHWVSFKGQGSYLPSPAGLNVDGKHVPQKGYITDELTDYAVRWLETRGDDRPFFLYLSHKAVHGHFVPAARHRGKFRDRTFVPPATMRAGSCSGAPLWVQNQRNSWHGVEFPFYTDLDIGNYYKQYAETLLAVDDSVGRIVELLRRKGWLDSTLIVFLGDNGFAFGEHGLIDKRTAYEESMRIPLLMHCPELFRGGTTVERIAANIDIAPTIIEAAGLKPPASFDGRSLLPLAEGRAASWRDALLYEYYWERNYPMTPTLHALRGERYKYIHCHGIWDTDELYDLRDDPVESKNLIRSPAHAAIVRDMKRQMFAILEQTGGMSIPINPDRGGSSNMRNVHGSKAAPFPSEMLREPMPPPRQP